MLIVFCGPLRGRQSGGIISVLSWLRSITAGGAPVEMKFADNEQHFHGLDMKAAIDAHNAWKTRLAAQIRGDASESLEVATVAADCNCVLGKWIHGEGRQRFAGSAEYAQLKATHAEFHLCAGSILRAAHDGDKESAEIALKRDLRHHSDGVQLALVRLFAHANAVNR